MSGNESLNTSASKNVSRTSGQPGLVRISAAIPPSTTTIEIAAIALPRRVRARRAASRSWRRRDASARRSASFTLGSGAVLLEDGGLGDVAHPLLLDRGQLARLVQGRDRGRDAVGQRRVLLQQRAPLVAAGGGELPDDRRRPAPGPRSGSRRSGTSTTIASTWSFLSALTTSLEVSNTCGSDAGWITSLTASRLRGADLDADVGVLRGRRARCAVELASPSSRRPPARPRSRASEKSTCSARFGVIEIWLTSKSKSFGPGA